MQLTEIIILSLILIALEIIIILGGRIIRITYSPLLIILVLIELALILKYAKVLFKIFISF